MARQQGSIYGQKLKSGRRVWKVEVEIGKKADGTRIRRRRTANSLAEARTIRKDLLELAETGIQASQSQQRLDIFAMWWIREVKAWTVKPATTADYEHRYRKHISPTLGNKKIEAITSRDVFAWRSSLKAKGYSTPTINGALQVLKAILNAAIEEGAIRTSPARKVSKLTKPMSEPTQVKAPLTPAEARKLLSACQDDAVGVGTALALVLGLRKGEVLGLKWRDFDFKAKKISVVRTLREVTTYDEAGRGHTSLEEGTPKTRASVRVLTLPDKLWALLNRRHINFSFGRPDPAEYWITGDLEGVPLAPGALIKGFKSLSTSVGLRNIRFHDLRHTAATLSVGAGARLEAVSQSLGHTRIDTTKSIYARSVPELSREFADSMGQVLGPSETA